MKSTVLKCVAHRLNSPGLSLAVLLFLLMVASACGPSSGPFSDYYVSPSGVDNPSRGRSATEPWQTIAYALDHADYAGDAPRIHLAPGTYQENFAITRSVSIVGSGVGDPFRDRDLTIIEPATRPSSTSEPHYTVSGGAHAEFSDLVFRYSRMMVTEGTLYLEDVNFWWGQGLYLLKLRDVSSFNVVNTNFITQPRVYSDTAVMVMNSIGEIHGGEFGDRFDHVISMTKIEPGVSDSRSSDGYVFSHPITYVLIDGATIRGSNVSYADGIRVFFDATAIIRNSTITRDHPDAEAWVEGTSDGSAAGIDLLYERAGRSSSRVEMIGNTISGFDVGIAMNLGGKRIMAQGNDISGVSYPVKTHSGNSAYIDKAPPVIDFGGGPLGSAGGNIFRNVGAYAFLHQHTYDIDACFNDWQVASDAEIERRIYDQRDDASLGRVHWNCSEAIIAGPTNATPEIVQIFTETPEPQPIAPSANVDTLCWEGPGSLYEVISSIKKGTPIELRGVGLGGGWLVIDNPRYPGVNCWVPEDTLDVDPSIDLGALPVFDIPPLPTPETSKPPAAPGQLDISNRVCTDQAYSVTLTWVDAADNEDGYRVYRNGSLIATLGANEASYTDQAPYGGPYTYGVDAFNDAGASARPTVQEAGCIY